MTGATPFRKRPFRRKKASEAQQGGTGPTDAAQASAESSAPVPSSDPVDGTPGEAAGVQSEGQDLPVPLDDSKGSVTGTRRLAALTKGVPALKKGVPALKSSVPALKNGVRKGGEGAKAALAHLTDRVIENAPRVPVRDLATLRKQFPGLTPEQLADKLVAGAANGTSTVGAGIGAAAMMPVPPAMPAELAAEITGVAAIELKLIAELHEVYGQRPPGNLKQRTIAYLGSWAEERGVDITKPTTLNAALGGQMKRELRQQIMKRMVRNLPNLMPFMVGAAVGAVMNRRDTKKLAEHIRKDLRTRQVPWDALPELPPLDHARELRELEAARKELEG
ncbi:hypothetical protein GCM10010329_27810 [Streptomyces spiroverticillatus]|uniref:EcsC family protein n=1 Tax=Streptomyces finlayi TaxID=67296 RepID=A0A918WVP4_9ACTN|nr:hypothetical protein [Streptomyces finlayi]GHA03784.1 hypothetical protein GCM10010329_27810 [Streptomyces spiroverticillatus]GHC87921.1 hypothetical protein GCM10010334_20220 [Streptomyces finlayi]